MMPADVDVNTFYIFAVSLIVISMMLKAYNDNIFTSAFFLISVMFLAGIVLSEAFDFLRKRKEVYQKK